MHAENEAADENHVFTLQLVKIDCNMARGLGRQYENKCIVFDDTNKPRLIIDTKHQSYVYANSSTTKFSRSIKLSPENEDLLLSTSQHCPSTLTVDRNNFHIIEAESPCDPMN